MSLPFGQSAAVKLRDYQSEALGAILAAKDRGVRRGLVVMPTGTGKSTVLASNIGAFADEDPIFTALVVAHRIEIIDQLAGAIEHICPHLKVDIHVGGHKASKHAQVVVGGVQALGMPGAPPEILTQLAPSLVIVDEAHHAAADSYQRVFQRTGCYDPFGPVLTGYTATDHRLDGLTLTGDKCVFEEVVYRYPLRKALSDGWLVDAQGYKIDLDLNLDKVKETAGDYNEGQLERAMNTEPVNEAAFKGWEEIGGRKLRTIVFCVTVDHAQTVAEVFREHGVKAETVWGDMGKEARKETLRKFACGEIDVVTNCQILTEGADIPAASCVLMLRPTKSWSLYVQMVGRGLRPLPGVVDKHSEPLFRCSAIAESAKPRCVVIDVVDNAVCHSIANKPDDGKSPSLNGMFGLPSTLDTEGATVSEALVEYEELDEMTQAAVRQRPTKFTGLKAKVQQFQMLAALDEASEAKEAETSFYWLKTGDLAYIAGCGWAMGEVNRTATIVGDFVGNWVLRLKSTNASGQVLRDEERHLPRNLAAAFIEAEHVITREFHGVARFAHKAATWRTGVATAMQLQALRAYGVPEDILQTLDRSKASLMITRLRAQEGR